MWHITQHVLFLERKLWISWHSATTTSFKGGLEGLDCSSILFLLAHNAVYLHLKEIQRKLVTFTKGLPYYASLCWAQQAHIFVYPFFMSKKRDLYNSFFTGPTGWDFIKKLDQDTRNNKNLTKTHTHTTLLFFLQF